MSFVGILRRLVSLWPDADGTEQSGLWTLSATPGEITTINIPDDARIIILDSPSARIRWRINADPAAAGAGAFAAGGSVGANARVAMLLEAGTSRTLRLRSTTASATVTVEWRP